MNMTCKSSRYSVYFDGPLDIEFRRMYRGVIVNAHNYPDGGHFGIRKHSVKLLGKMFPRNWVMLKTRREKLYEIHFRDSLRTIELVADRSNPSPNKMKFNRRTYEDLKENIPCFLKEVGFEFETRSDGDRTLLILEKSA